MTPDDLLTKISEDTKVSTDEIRGRSRKAPVVFARQLFHTFTWYKFGNRGNHKGLTKIQIGYLTGHDHASVIHSIHTIEDLKLTNKQYRDIINSLQIKYFG